MIKCPRCFAPISKNAKECPECNFDKSKMDDCYQLSLSRTGNKFNGSCDLCGKRGRLIEIDQGKNKKPLAYYRCFDCHENETIGKNHRDLADKGIDLKQNRLNINPIYRKYLESLREYYHKPMFYGEKPRLDIIKTFEDAWATEQLMEIKRNRNMGNNRT